MEEWKGAHGWGKEGKGREERRGKAESAPMQHLDFMISRWEKSEKEVLFCFFLFFASSDMLHITTSPPTRGAGSSQRRTDGR